jgi:hypothetical protein
MIDRTTDSLEVVFAYMDDSHVGSPDRQTHLLHLEAFVNALATNGLAINLEKCISPLLGHQAIATFPRHGELLPSFFAKLCTGVAPFNQSSEWGAPKRWSGLTRHRRLSKIQSAS